MKFLLFIVIFSSQLFAAPLTKEDIGNLSYNKLQKLRMSYIEFVIKAQSDYSEKVTSIFKDYGLISTAIASDGTLCFFGGWPSKYEGKYCRAPWKKKDDELVQRYGVMRRE